MNGITTEYTIWCSACPAWHQDTSLGTKAKTVKYFRSLGWKEIDGEWVCPECARKLAKKEKAK